MRSNGRTTIFRGLTLLTALAALVPAFTMGSGRADVISFGKATRLGAGAEPQVVIADDGTVFVDAPTGTPGHSALWRQGTTSAKFDPIAFTSPYNKFPGGGDAAVSLAPGRRVYFLDLWLGSDSLTVSQDDGATWTSGNPFTSLPPSDRQWIATGPRDPATGNDTLYIEYHLVPTGVLMFGKSTDGGLTWIPGVVGGAGVPQEGVTANPLVSDGNFVATNFVAAAGQMMVATSNDGGSTWTTTKASYLKNLATNSIENMAMDGQNLWLAYVDNQYQIQVLHSPDRGVHWENAPEPNGPGYPAQLTDGGSNIYPWISARNGKVGISWYENAAATGSPDAANGQWDLMYSELTGHDQYGNLAFTTPVVAAAKVKTGPICTQGVQCTGNRELGDFQSLAIDQTGAAVISYVSGSLVYVVKQS